MPYSRVWSKTTPPDPQDANTIAAEIRNLREDIEERMAALVVGWSTPSPTDPVVPSSDFLASQTVNGAHSGNVTETQLPNYLHAFAAAFFPTDGRGLQVRCLVDITASATGTTNFRVKLGGVQLYLGAWGSSEVRRLLIDLILLRTGAATSELVASSALVYDPSGGPFLLDVTSGKSAPIVGNPAITWANALNLELTAQMGAAGSGIITVLNWLVKKI